MKITQPGHAKLQAFIAEWMRENIQEAAPLFKEPTEGEDWYGVPVNSETTATASLVSMHAATAAYRSVLQSLHVLGLAKLG